MKKTIILIIPLLSLFTFSTQGQTQQDSLDIQQVALDYIESQHNVNPEQFERAAHPRMVKRTFWTDKQTGKEYLRETFRSCFKTPIIDKSTHLS